MNIITSIVNLFKRSKPVPAISDLQTAVAAIKTNADAITTAVTNLQPRIAALKDGIPQQVIDDLTNAGQSLASAAVAINAMP